MVPVGGPELQDVGLLGSPSFEIPRSVARDRQLEHYRDGPTASRTACSGKNTAQHRHDDSCTWPRSAFFVHLVTLLGAVEMDQYAESGWRRRCSTSR